MHLDCEENVQPNPRIASDLRAEADSQRQAAEKHRQLAEIAHVFVAAIGKCLSVTEEQVAAASALIDCTATESAVAAAIILVQGCHHIKCPHVPGVPDIGSTNSQHCASDDEKQAQPRKSDHGHRAAKEANEVDCIYVHELDWDALSKCMDSALVAKNSAHSRCPPPSLQELRSVLEQNHFDPDAVKALLECLRDTQRMLEDRKVALQLRLRDLSAQRTLYEVELKGILSRGDNFQSLWQLLESAQEGAQKAELFQANSSHPTRCSFMAQPISSVTQPLANSEASEPKTVTGKQQQNTSDHEMNVTDTIPAAHWCDSNTDHSAGHYAVTSSGTVPVAAEDHGWMIHALTAMCSDVGSSARSASMSACPALQGNGNAVKGLFGVLQSSGLGICPVTGLSASQAKAQCPAHCQSPCSPVLEELDKDGLMKWGCEQHTQGVCGDLHSDLQHSPQCINPEKQRRTASSSTQRPFKALVHTDPQLHSPASPVPCWNSRGDSMSAITVRRPGMPSKSEESARSIAEAAQFSEKLARKQQQLVELRLLQLHGIINQASASSNLQNSKDEAEKILSQQQVCGLTDFLHTSALFGAGNCNPYFCTEAIVTHLAPW